MAISASLVKVLRDKTGAGMMDCKTALSETDGDIEAAIDWLRKKGIAKADKKSSRTAAEGLVGVASVGKRAAVVEVNSETDFVARNDGFQKLVSDIAKVTLDTDGSVDAINAAQIDGKSVAECVTAAISTIGENMNVRRATILEVANGVVASYVHNAAAPKPSKVWNAEIDHREVLKTTPEKPTAMAMAEQMRLITMPWRSTARPMR